MDKSLPGILAGYFNIYLIFSLFSLIFYQNISIRVITSRALRMDAVAYESDKNPSLCAVANRGDAQSRAVLVLPSSWPHG